MDTTHTKLPLILLFAATALGGCDKGDNCAKLASAICDGKDAGCKEKATKWIGESVDGPNGKLSGDELSEACGVVTGDAETQKLYVQKAHEDLSL